MLREECHKSQSEVCCHFPSLLRTPEAGGFHYTPIPKGGQSARGAIACYTQKHLHNSVKLETLC